MQAVSYLKICEEHEARRGFCGVREDEHLYGTENQLYDDLLNHLSKEFLKEKYSLCLQVRDKNDVLVYEFPKVACPELFLEQLKIRKL
jgi:hypothetical protein